MAKTFLTSINLNKNELQNFVVHVLATAPAAPVESQMYYNSTDQALYMYIGAQWVDITGRVRSITSNTAALTVDNTDPSNPALSVADANGTSSGLLSSAFYNDLLNATNLNTASTLVKRDVNGDFSAGTITATSVTGLSAPTLASDAVTKAYVDNIVSSGLAFQGNIDASTNPLYPAASQGDMWRISVAGLIGGVSGVAVEPGDMVVCIAASSVGGAEGTVGAEFSILQNNITGATETVAGTARIATPAEVNAGTNSTAYVTPATLASELLGLGAGTVASFNGLIGDGAATSIAVTHNLGNQFCAVQLYDATTNAEVIPDITLTDANTVTLGFNVAPTLNQYRVVVLG